MGKPAVNRRPLTLIGGLLALGPGCHAGGNDAVCRRGADAWSLRAVQGVADHLNNPRGLPPAPGGGLYLAEAGSGGGVCVAGGEQGQTCVGLTASFDLVTSHGVKCIVTGLLSGSGAGGIAAEGPELCPTGGQVVRIS